MSLSGAERRKGKRVDANLKLEVQIPSTAGGVSPATMETLNLSTSGVYFRSDHYIEPMTRLEMKLELPVDDEGGVAAATCEGIVVRVVPEDPTVEVDQREIAVFFTRIDDEGLQHLEDHIARLLAID